MNIILLTNDFPFGKKETYLETEILFLSKRFKSITIITSSKEKKCRQIPKNVFVHNVNRYYRFLNCFLFSLLKIFNKKNVLEFKTHKQKYGSIKTFKTIFKCNMILERYYLFCKNKGIFADLVYSYWMNELVLSAIKISNGKSVVVSRVHGFELRDDEVYIPFRQEIEEKTNILFFISKNGIAKYKSIIKNESITFNINCKKQLARLGVISNNTNILNYPPNKKSFCIVSCSLIYGLKRLDLIINLLKILEKKNYEMTWVHFGDGPDFGKIKELSSICLKKTNVVFKGHCENKEIYDFYTNNYVDLFINLSDSEGIPVSIMEAQSFGIPVLARNVGGISEIVNNEVGHLIRNESDIINESVGFVSKLLAMKDAELYNNLHNRVFSFYKKNYDAYNNYEMFCDILEDKK